MVINNKSTTRQKKVEQAKLTCSCQSLVPIGARRRTLRFPSANSALSCHKRLDGLLRVPFGHRGTWGLMGVVVVKWERLPAAVHLVFSSGERKKKHVKEEVEASDVQVTSCWHLFGVKVCQRMNLLTWCLCLWKLKSPSSQADKIPWWGCLSTNLGEHWGAIVLCVITKGHGFNAFHLKSGASEKKSKDLASTTDLFSLKVGEVNLA